MAFFILLLLGCGEDDKESSQSTLPSYTDTRTNLIWYDGSSSVKQPWPIADNICFNLDSGNFGWRLPTVDELHGAYNIWNVFDSYERDWYWSSTYSSFNYIVGQPQYKIVNLSSSEISATNQTNARYYRCVRDMN